MSSMTEKDPSLVELRNNIIQRVNVGDLLVRSAARAPDHLAVVDQDRRFSYGEFNRWVNRLAHGLIALGFRRGEALAIMSRNNAEFLAQYFACAKIGVVCVPVNLRWRREEIVYVLGHSEVRGIVVEGEFRADIEEVRARLDLLRHIVVLNCEPDRRRDTDIDFGSLAEGMADSEPECYVADRDPVSYLYTSGTTSAPKGVVGSHLAIYMGALGMALDSGLRASDRVLAMLPLFHTTPLNSLCTPAVAVGATIYLQQGFEAQAVLELFDRERISVLIALPIMYRALLQSHMAAPRDVSGLRLAIYGMARMPRHELEQLIRIFDCDFALIFGQTEMSPVTSIFQPEHQLSHAGAAGTPSVNVQIGIMNPEGRLLPQGEIGEIVYRGPQTLNCYLHNEAATEEAFKNGWFHSGDAGYFDTEGLLWFQDRFKDVIKTGGENVASVEVEQALYNVEPGILEVVVIGLPHERWGEAVTAIVVPRPGATPAEKDILQRLRKTLAAHKNPKAVIFTDTLPKTATGKVQKSELRKRYADLYAGRKDG